MLRLGRQLESGMEIIVMPGLCFFGRAGGYLGFPILPFVS